MKALIPFDTIEAMLIKKWIYKPNKANRASIHPVNDFEQ